MKHARGELDRLIGAIRRRWIAWEAVSIAARVLVACALVLALATLVERGLRPEGSVLLLLAGAAAVCAVAAGLLLAIPLRTRPDERQIARFIEERCPELNDGLVTAVDLAARNDAGPFAPLVIDAAAGQLRTIAGARIIEPARTRGTALRLVLAVGALAIAALFGRPFLDRVGEEARLRFWPASVSITVDPGDVRVPAGHPVTIAAHVIARNRRLTRVAPVIAIDTGGHLRSIPMTSAGDSYRLTLDRVERSFTYRVTAGPAASRPYFVTALHPPRVTRIELRYEYPAFTGLKPHDEPDGGDVYGPRGTRVRLRVHADKPIAEARLAYSDRRVPQPLTHLDDRTLESTITLGQETAYRVALVDRDGLASDGIEYFVRLMDDRPPDVHILRPVGDQQITPLEEVPVEARADDDYGIASFEMVYSVAGGAEKAVPFTRLAGTDTARVGSMLLAAEDLHVKPGDVIAYYARARDVPHAKAASLSRSEIFFLEVKPFNEEYVLAASQAMSGATGTQIESLVAAQKEIISATWNLERRSGAGRSAADIKAVAAAQAELKRRAEQATGNTPSRRRADAPPEALAAQPAAMPGAPVTQAVVSMQRAVEQLQGEHTSTALPHEMAALAALLQAQAEIRRRQVSEQRAGATSFGNGRQGQDLSSLFDRELKRQSRTNYETRASVEQQQNSQNDAPLDRIRDLARRQEALADRARALGKAGLSPEEVKRQLERLARDEEQLRRELEATQGSQGSRGSRGSQGSPGSQGSRGSQGSEASRQMRETAEELRRGNADAAAAKAEAAAGELRNTQQQAVGTSGQTQKLADQLDQLRSARERLEALEKRLRDAEHAARGGRGELDRLRQQYADEVQRTRELMDRAAGRPQSGLGYSTPEQHEWSRSAPGTEAWKQDYSDWRSLASDVAESLDRYEASLAARLSGSMAKDRLRSGGSDRVPDGYEGRVSRYFALLASQPHRANERR
jgi:hypothetical protein